MLDVLAKVNADVTIGDQSEKLIVNSEKLKVNTQVGSKYLQNLDKFEVIIKSPGIPPCPELDAVGDKLTNSTQIFLDTVMEAGSTVIGVTGSKGKSTTVSLIHEILKNAGKKSYLVGNIGEPSITYVDKANEDTYFVLEMSSYQLMHCKTSPQIAVITSFFPEHLDYHGSTSLTTSKSPVENYLDAKKNIARFQTEDDVIFYNSEYEETKTIANESKGQCKSFSKSDSPLELKETKLLGEHNLINISAAYAVASHIGVADADAIEAIKKFEGLPHRLQNLGKHNGIIWVDDSISTTPETAIAAIDALGDQVETIILGGQDRGNDFSELGKLISSSSVKNVILMGESGPRIKQSIESAGAKVRLIEVNNMQEAIEESKQATSNQQLVTLLSPASPSYGMYKDFEERGNEFRSCVLS